MGLDRNSNTDAGRKGSGARGTTKADAGYFYTFSPAKGRFLPAYGGGMGKRNDQYDPDIGTALDEVGNDAD